MVLLKQDQRQINASLLWVILQVSSTNTISDLSVVLDGEDAELLILISMIYTRIRIQVSSWERLRKGLLHSLS